jgi:hypothetical protein
VPCNIKRTGKEGWFTAWPSLQVNFRIDVDSTTCAAPAEQPALAPPALRHWQSRGKQDVPCTSFAQKAQPLLLRHSIRMLRDGKRFAFTRYCGSGPAPLPRGRRLGVHGLHRRDILRLNRCGSRLLGAKECLVSAKLTHRWAIIHKKWMVGHPKMAYHPKMDGRG